MARVLLILSIVLTLVSAGLGFVAKQKVDDLNAAIKTTTGKLHQTENTLKKTQADLDATKKELDTAKQQLEEATTALAAAKKEAEDATKKLADATASLETKTKALADLEEQVKILKGNNPDKNLPELIEQMKGDLAKAQTELAESKQVQETLNQRVKDAEEKAAKSENTVKAYQWGTVKPGLSGRVLAYNPGWNFVVLSIGDKSGLKSGVNMVIQRGNTMIAKVKVTTVEPNTAIADVLPGTMRGSKVEPGDTVIYEGAR